MIIYIPKHIRNIGVVNTMCELIEGYNGSVYESNFNNYYYYLNTDPVNRFLHICISESDIGNEEKYNNVINYISKLFYSVKGTLKVFDFMKKYLGLRIKDDNIFYNVRELRFTIEEVTLSEIDENIYYEALIDFLEALLYFGSASITIDLINLNISNTLKNYTGAQRQGRSWGCGRPEARASDRSCHGEPARAAGRCAYRSFL